MICLHANLKGELIMWLIIVLIIAIIVVVAIIGYKNSQSKSDNMNYSEEALKNMPLEQLDKLHLELAHLVMPTFSEPANKKIPFGTDGFGCKTWGEARDLMDLVAKVYNEKLPKNK